ncbi:MAG TPA: hypothetical protein VGR64_06320 [Terracidiphilus sp.]|nr:hypothetical protein [Terracidiphilus sp.]
MKPFLELNLRDDRDKPAAPALNKPESEEPRPAPVAKRVNRLANKAAHRAATHSGTGSGLFSK